MLFTESAVITESQLDSIQVKLSQMKLCRPRSLGNCWLACLLWKQLGLDEFWQERIDESRGDIAWSKVIKLLAINCLIQPASGFYVHSQWFNKTTDGRMLQMWRYSQPEPEHQIILDVLKLDLPNQPPPKIYMPFGLCTWYHLWWKPILRAPSPPAFLPLICESWIKKSSGL